eukprot:CAMPEP_0172322826 /NCGR_PEP_ID=MMETSP1058-20130122/47004_1 /TAXON_ID=83371 /ORGANISM="Detonula confervacea, Strain CCMP 353" /LENGTH=472 /DNA_ID=CAMNT_0013038673 /DNA_START=163 /DNA_END=1581 /DNA_ORIENTATION=+
MEGRLQEHLDRRQREGTLRSLMPLPKPIDTLEQSQQISPTSPDNIDFASNDYLGLARCRDQHASVQSAYEQLFSPDDKLHPPLLGASGSRLLSGDSHLARSLEGKLAQVHNRPGALLFNSGYDANLSILSSLPYREDDAIVMDELVHNSLVMGVRMGRLKKERVFLFRHNDVMDLKRVLEGVASSSSTLASTIVVVESVYSMDGDIAPLKEIMELAQDMGAGVMVDEAHGLGVYGHTNKQNLQLTMHETNFPRDEGGSNSDKSTIEKKTIGGTGVIAALDLESHPALLCSIHTFGKAAGCHGAVVAGSSTLMSYLVNYARPFVYSTALPPHSLISIQQSYESMMGPVGERRRTRVFQLVKLFREDISNGITTLKEDFPNSDFELLPSPSPIQAIVVPGNKRCISVCQYLRKVGKFDVYPIRSPTVAKGQERIRIILHSHNNEDDVHALTTMLLVSLRQLMAYPDDLKLTSKL